jgi:alanyl-tRNA synthetase
MTQRLYYQDAYCTTFTARIVERVIRDGRPAAVPDRTAFYPTGGGQPNDKGELGNALVVDVIERDSDSAVLHILSGDIAGDEVTGKVDWPRRFDLMQQHTGQHILSQAFVQATGAETVGFHLSDDIDEGSLTIDLDRKDLAQAEIDRAEDLANRIVFEDRPVTARFVTAQELAELPLRKPPQVEEDVRIVQVKDFDASPCGGTHVARTGEVGLIKIVKLERRSDAARVEFRCGQRALLDFRRKNHIVNQVASALSVGYGELDQAVERMQVEAKDLRRKLAEAEAQILMYKVAELDSAAEDRGDFRLIARWWGDHEGAGLRALAKKLAGKPRTVVLLGVGGDQPLFVFARSPDLTLDLVPLVRGAIERIGGKGGGGKPDFAQGGGPPASESQVRAAIEWAVGQAVG